MKLVYDINQKPPLKKNLVYAFQQLLAFCNSFPAETSDGDGAIAYASSADIAIDDAM